MADRRDDIRAGRTGAYDGRVFAPWLVLILILALFAAAAWASGPARAEAPGFAVTTTGWDAQGKGQPEMVRLEDYRGQVVVLDLMAVSCSPCRDVADVLRPLWENGTAVLSVDAWSDAAYPGWQPGIETAEALVRLQQEEGLAWPHALDTDGVWRKYGVDALPRVLVIDAHGRVAYDHQGVPDGHDLERALATA